MYSQRSLKNERKDEGKLEADMTMKQVHRDSCLTLKMERDHPGQGVKEAIARSPNF